VELREKCGLLSEETEILIPARFVVARALEKKSEKYLATKKINEHLWTYNFLLLHQILSPWSFLWSIGQTERGP